MSAERLRVAAALLRERAEAATPGPWEDISTGTDVSADHPTFANAGRMVATTDFGFADCAGNAAYIAAVHPNVALAVADLLDNEASLIDSAAKHPDLHGPINQARTGLLLTIADAILAGGGS